MCHFESEEKDDCFATMRDLHRVDSSKAVDPRFAVPLCVQENRLAGDLLPPNSPHMAKTAFNPRRDRASPTSVKAVLNALPRDTKDAEAKSKKKNKKSKGKLFRTRRRVPKEHSEDIDIARQKALRKQALRLKRIRDEEDADFGKLRAEEETSPKLDMLAHYPLTLMEEVLSIPIRPSVDSDEEEEEEEAEPSGPIKGTEVEVIDLGRFKDQVYELRLSKMDLRQFVSHEGNFARLQKELRMGGVITDETLRQRIHVLCRPDVNGDGDDASKCRDIFSTPACRNRGFGSNLPSAYRRMNEFSTEIDWRQEIEKDPTLPSSNTQESMKTKKNWSDVKLLNLVSNYSQKGRDSYHTQFQDAVEESDMVASDRNLKDGVDLLTYCVHDLVPIVQEQEVFTNLQEELRKIGAVTNEVLKQGLHFYVRDVRLQKERQEAAIRAMEEKQCGDMKDEGSRHDSGGTKRKPLLTKLRLRSSRRSHY